MAKARTVLTKINYEWVRKDGKTFTPWAAAALLIREDLKEAFPGVKFRVSSRVYAGGDSVDIEWQDGPTSMMVDSLTGKYQEGHFDGMIDLYEYSNTDDSIPQVRYVQTSRDSSNEVRTAIIAQVNATYGWDLKPEVTPYGQIWVTQDSNQFIPGEGMRSDYIHRFFHQTSYICPDCKTLAQPEDLYCGECGKRLRGRNPWEAAE